MDFLQFVVERYNYWIFIVLMMIGLYTVIARGNLVKKIVGLNIFQTSVFIYYISIGKVTGGTAPIYVPGDMEARTDHGDGHGSGHGGDHGASLHEAPHADPGDAHGANDLAGAAATHAGEAPKSTSGAADALHAADAANAHLAEKSDAYAMTEAAPHAPGAAAADSLEAAFAEVVYSNPLPHVLILTAIVVGVATTAVGLALAVRVREAYGTIEEDELEAADNVSEFGRADPREPLGAEARA